ncbi:MAG: hypothetical protein C5B47_03525 [Verrucomicrobia bacterium]|nr:MAG: hypothetical protein C5B47_03525 [Verrucomicrobiota bacterium]
MVIEIIWKNNNNASALSKVQGPLKKGISHIGSIFGFLAWEKKALIGESHQTDPQNRNHTTTI